MVIWPTRQDGLINRTVRQESGWCEFLLFGWMAAKLVSALAVLFGRHAKNHQGWFELRFTTAVS